jgi:hypothetical protein
MDEVRPPIHPKVIAANMKSTADEAQWFWPIYEQYINELVQIDKAKYDLIKEYLQSEKDDGGAGRYSLEEMGRGG